MYISSMMMYTLQPLGDQAALLHFADEAAAARFASNVRGAADPWLVDVVQAYTSVAVFFDLDRTRFAQVADRLRCLEQQAETQAVGALPGKLHLIPCCYELQLDMTHVM